MESSPEDHNVEASEAEPLTEQRRRHRHKKKHSSKEKKKHHKNEVAICSYPHGERPVLPQIFALVAVICSINAFPWIPIFFGHYEDNEFACAPECHYLFLTTYYDTYDSGKIEGFIVGTVFAIFATTLGAVALALLMTAICLPISTNRVKTVALLLLFSSIAQILPVLAVAVPNIGVERLYLKSGAVSSLFAFFAYVAATISSFRYYRSLQSDSIEITRDIGTLRAPCFTYPHGERPILPQILTLMAFFCSIRIFPLWSNIDFGCFEFTHRYYPSHSRTECYQLRVGSSYDITEADWQVGATFGAFAATLGAIALSLLFTATCFAIKPRRAKVAMILLIISSVCEILTFIAAAAFVSPYVESSFHLAKGGVFAIFAILLYIAAAIATGKYYKSINQDSLHANPRRTSALQEADVDLEQPEQAP